jgi:hypothetical protein
MRSIDLSKIGFGNSQPLRRPEQLPIDATPPL